jgi:hypothetical protein
MGDLERAGFVVMGEGGSDERGGERESTEKRDEFHGKT